jgi:hypothetical protein
MFEEVQLKFLVVGHTHKDIDGNFDICSKIWRNMIIMSWWLDGNVHDFIRLSLESSTYLRNFGFQNLGQRMFGCTKSLNLA